VWSKSTCSWPALPSSTMLTWLAKCCRVKSPWGALLSGLACCSATLWLAFALLHGRGVRAQIYGDTTKAAVQAGSEASSKSDTGQSTSEENEYALAAAARTPEEACVFWLTARWCRLLHSRPPETVDKLIISFLDEASGWNRTFSRAALAFDEVARGGDGASHVRLANLAAALHLLAESVRDPAWRFSRRPLLLRMASRTEALRRDLEWPHSRGFVAPSLPSQEIDDLLSVATSLRAELREEEDLLEPGRDARMETYARRIG